MPDLSPGPSSQAEKVALSFGGEEGPASSLPGARDPSASDMGTRAADKAQRPLQGPPPGRHKSPLRSLVLASVKSAN